MADSLSTVLSADGASGGEDVMSFDTTENRIDSTQETSTDGAPETPVAAADASNDNPVEGAQAPQFPDELFKEVSPEVAELMRAAATSGEYDLNDPKFFKAVRQIAEKESLIRGSKVNADPSAEAQSYLDAFRDPKPATPEAKDGQPPADTAAGQKPLPKFIELANKWKEPEREAFVDLMGAYDLEDSNPEKPAAVYTAHKAIQDRVFHEEHLPRVRDEIYQALEHFLGPQLRESRERQDEAFRHDIVKKLATQPGYEDVMDLFQPSGRGEVTIDGQKFQDAWINHIFAENPELNDIQIGDLKTQESKRLTMAKRFSAAHRLMKAQRPKGADPKSVTAAVKAGIAIEQSKRDTTRTSLNSGGTGVPSGSRDADDIFGTGVNPNSLEAMFSK